MRRFTQPGKRIASFTRTFARMRWALMFDGVGVRGQLANRAINPDGDIDIEWEQLFYNSSIFSAQTIVAQTEDSSIREYIIRAEANEAIHQNIEGTVFVTPSGLYGNGKWRSTVIGNTWTVYKNGSVVYTLTISRGTGREPSAKTYIGARISGGAFIDYISGCIFNIRISGKLYPMRDYNQYIQLPNPTGLGAELITQYVLENPTVKGSQWTYLGDGRWQLIGDGNQNDLVFLGQANSPSQGFLEFEIESMNGQLTCSQNGVSGSIFNSVGVKRYFYTNINSGGTFGSLVIFKRFPAGQPVSCIIKNISLKSLDTCNPMTIANATSTNWVQVVDDYVAKFRKILRLDGIGARGVFSNRAINPDGDIDIEFYTPSNIENTGFDRVILSQCLSGTFSSREFELLISGLGALAVNVGGTVSTLAFPGTFSAQEKLRVLISGSTATTYKSNGDVIRTFNIVRGAAREPLAQTTVGARFNGTSYLNFSQGIQRNIKINGSLWPIADANQTIQLPEPSGLGAELLDSSSFLEPNGYVNTIVTTGFNSFKVLAPTSGATRAAKAFTLPNASDTVVMEFDFVSKDPDALLSVFIRDGVVVGGGAVTWSANLSSLGKQRFIIKNSSITLKNILFAVNVPCTFEIRNISIKPLGTCNPITLTNVTSANWEDLEI